MYDTGARVQEIIDLKPSSLRLDVLNTIRIAGKGNKTRIVPMLEDQVKLLKPYIAEHGLDQGANNEHPLFFNSRGEKLTRAGVTHILLKYADRARSASEVYLPDKISCHVLRHSKAMHLFGYFGGIVTPFLYNCTIFKVARFDRNSWHYPSEIPNKTLKP